LKETLAFVAGGTMLRVDVVHCDFEHVIAANTHSVDLWGRFVVRRFIARVIRVGLLSFAHIAILA
jgi:hypothetical protein